MQVELAIISALSLYFKSSSKQDSAFKEQLVCAGHKSRGLARASCCYQKIAWICGNEHVKYRKKR
jgi:hypothetical protein